MPNLSLFSNLLINREITIKNYIQTPKIKIILLSTGKVLVMGNNAHGQLGLGHTKECLSLTMLDGIFDRYTISDIHSDGLSTFFITSTGQVIVCGKNHLFQLGIKSNRVSLPHRHSLNVAEDVVQPTLITGALHNKIVKDVFMSHHGEIERPYTFFLTDQGEVFRCGYNDCWRFGEMPFELERDPSLAEHCIVTLGSSLFASDKGKIFLTGKQYHANSIHSLIAEAPNEKIIKFAKNFLKIYYLTDSGKIFQSNYREPNVFSEIFYPEKIIDFIVTLKQIVALSESGKVYATDLNQINKESLKIYESFKDESIQQMFVKTNLVVHRSRQQLSGESLIYFISQDKKIYKCMLSEDSGLDQQPTLVSEKNIILGLQARLFEDNDNLQADCSHAIEVYRNNQNFRKIFGDTLSSDTPLEMTESFQQTMPSWHSLDSKKHYQFPADQSAIETVFSNLEKKLFEICNLPTPIMTDDFIKKFKNLMITIQDKTFTDEYVNPLLNALDVEHHFITQNYKYDIHSDSDQMIVAALALWKSLLRLITVEKNRFLIYHLQLLLLLHHLKFKSADIRVILNDVSNENILKIKSALGVLISKGTVAYNCIIFQRPSIHFHELIFLIQHPNIATQLASAIVWMKKHDIDVLQNQSVLIQFPHHIKKLTRLNIPRKMANEFFKSFMCDEVPMLDNSNVFDAHAAIEPITFNKTDLEMCLAFDKRLEAIYRETDKTNHDVPDYRHTRLMGYIESSSEKVTISSMSEIGFIAATARRVYDPVPRPTKQSELDALSREAYESKLLVKLFGKARAKYLLNLQQCFFYSDFLTPLFLIKPDQIDLLNQVHHKMSHIGFDKKNHGMPITNFWYSTIQCLLPLFESAEPEQMSQVATGLLFLYENNIANRSNILKLIECPEIADGLKEIYVSGEEDKALIMQQVFDVFVSFNKSALKFKVQLVDLFNGWKANVLPQLSKKAMNLNVAQSSFHFETQPKIIFVKDIKTFSQAIFYQDLPTVALTPHEQMIYNKTYQQLNQNKDFYNGHHILLTNLFYDANNHAVFLEAVRVDYVFISALEAMRNAQVKGSVLLEKDFIRVGVLVPFVSKDNKVSIFTRNDKFKLRSTVSGFLECKDMTKTLSSLISETALKEADEECLLNAKGERGLSIKEAPTLSSISIRELIGKPGNYFCEFIVPLTFNHDAEFMLSILQETQAPDAKDHLNEKTLCVPLDSNERTTACDFMARKLPGNFLYGPVLHTVACQANPSSLVFAHRIPALPKSRFYPVRIFKTPTPDLQIKDKNKRRVTIYGM